MKEKSLADLLNEWVEKNNIKEIKFCFSNNSTLFDDESIKNMTLIFYYLKNKKNITDDFDKSLSNRISKHMVNYLNSLFINEVSNEVPTKKEKRLKYEITPAMLKLRSGTYFVPKCSCNCHCDCNYR